MQTKKNKLVAFRQKLQNRPLAAIKCPDCKHMWLYRGAKGKELNDYVSCPKCKNHVALSETTIKALERERS